jgi:hypothetical protein
VVRRKQLIPSKGVGAVPAPKGILELDRFSNADLAGDCAPNFAKR